MVSLFWRRPRSTQMPRNPSAANLIAGLSGLRAAFAAMGMMPPGTPITVGLTRETGKQLEKWLVRSAPLEWRHQVNWLTTVDGPSPKRVLRVAGMRLEWPLQLVTLPSGSIVVEPMPFFD